MTAPRTPALADRLLHWWFTRRWRGLPTLIAARRALGGPARVRHRTSYGSVFALDPFAYIDNIVLRDGFYESEVFETLQPCLGPGAVFWDIGSNLGLHAVTAKLLHPATQVVSFEPNPAMVEEIEENARLNGVRFPVLPIALAESPGPRTLHVNTGGNAGMSTLHPWEGGHYDRQVTVDCFRGDTLVADGRVPAPTVIKLDVEGSEGAVLTGLGPLLARPELRLVVFEALPGLAQAPDSHPIAGPLRTAGFTFTPLVRHEHSTHPLENYAARRAA